MFEIIKTVKHDWVKRIYVARFPVSADTIMVTDILHRYLRIWKMIEVNTESNEIIIWFKTDRHTAERIDRTMRFNDIRWDYKELKLTNNHMFYGSWSY